ncbi:hypothetical protein, partial [Paraburkholderia domus]|uniref:hypothetical protein n=1 Tax=Paraburkholderia domus TaxID=2793075 RepID=UPI001B8B78C1
ACTIAVSVIAALPFTGIPHLRFSANAEPDAGLECFQGALLAALPRRLCNGPMPLVPAMPTP